MLILKTTELTVTLGASTVSPLPIVASYIDLSDTIYSPSPITTQTNGTNSVTILTSPASGYSRQVKLLTILNPNVATVQVNLFHGVAQLLSVNLQQNSSLVYTDGKGFSVVTSTGATITAVSSQANNDYTQFGLITFSRPGFPPFDVDPFSGACVTHLNVGSLNGHSAPAGTIVGDTDAQTLTNKTLTAPILNGDITGSYSLKGNATTWNVIVSATTGPVNDFAPGLVGNTVLRMNNSSTTTITGIAAGYTGQRLVILNVGSGQVDFVYNSPASAIGNKLIMPVSSMNTSLGAAGQGAIEFVYDGSARWMLVSHEQGGSIPFTPTITFGGASVGITYSSQGANYYIKGRNVFFSGSVTLSSKGSSVGTAEIRGIPTSNTSYYGTGQILSFSNMAGLTNGIWGLVIPGAVTLTLETGGAANAAFITDTNFTNTSSLLFGGTYTVS